MAKGSGTNRTSNPKSNVWDGSDDEQSIINASISIFKKEAKLGLGDYEKRTPTLVSSEEYSSMLASGEYVEIYHAGTAENNKKMIDGAYYYANQDNIYGPGYYFASNRGSVYLDTASRPDVVKALVKKSDVIARSQLESSIDSGLRKYASKKVVDNASSYDKKHVYSYTASAARVGKKVLAGEGSKNHYVVIDRSALYIER